MKRPFRIFFLNAHQLRTLFALSSFYFEHSWGVFCKIKLVPQFNPVIYVELEANVFCSMMTDGKRTFSKVSVSFTACTKSSQVYDSCFPCDKFFELLIYPFYKGIPVLNFLAVSIYLFTFPWCIFVNYSFHFELLEYGKY